MYIYYTDFYYIYGIIAYFIHKHFACSNVIDVLEIRLKDSNRLKSLLIFCQIILCLLVNSIPDGVFLLAIHSLITLNKFLLDYPLYIDITLSQQNIRECRLRRQLT